MLLGDTDEPFLDGCFHKRDQVVIKPVDVEQDDRVRMDAELIPGGLKKA